MLLFVFLYTRISINFCSGINTVHENGMYIIRYWIECVYVCK